MIARSLVYGDPRRPKRRRATTAQLRRLYRIGIRDELARGTPRRELLTFSQFVKVARLQERLAASDPGGNIVL